MTMGRSTTMLLGSVVAFAPALVVAQDPAERSTLTIRLADEHAWEGAVPADVRAVLNSVAVSLVPLVPATGSLTIEVHARGGPISLFERAPDGAVRVHLETGGRLWSQYAYQFSHELCHVLCRFDRDDDGNRWFEESLCETASLFVLRRMARDWRQSPPYPNWTTYAEALDAYAARLLDESRLPEGMTLATWYARHREELPARPTDRKNAGIVAASILRLFEEKPGRWAAVHWFNAPNPSAPQPFEDHLSDWRRLVPPDHAETIDRIAEAFGIADAVPTTAAP